MTHPASLAESISAPPLTPRNKLAVLVWRALPILILAPVTYCALFRLPFHFPPRQRLMSASYAFGFNNSVAILALAAILAILTLIYLLRSRTAGPLPIAFVDQKAAGISPAHLDLGSKRRRIQAQNEMGVRHRFDILRPPHIRHVYIQRTRGPTADVGDTAPSPQNLADGSLPIASVHADCGGIWTDSYLCSVRDVLAAQTTGRFA